MQNWDNIDKMEQKELFYDTIDGMCRNLRYQSKKLKSFSLKLDKHFLKALVETQK